MNEHQNLRKGCGITGYWQERKSSKKKEGEPPYGKVENAKSAFPTFPQGLPPDRKERREKRRINKEGGCAADILTELHVSYL
jgi:hypothetical protein